ncbi:ATP-binding protein [Actinosynnema sp. CS-041913]|uniref:ATP-binding protein n=1 Tax=Actinosynnema sp. CS-041913 TaxID=3239917 RepID=UPI003D932A6F
MDRSDGLRVHNTVPGTAGGVVQAGVVHGDVHLHPPPPVLGVPRQLPAAPGVFAGRGTELAELDRALTASSPNNQADAGSRAGTAATIVISAIGGAGGIGKTWLALRWAHARAEWFPDGQLFVDLRGFSPTERPMPPGEAVRGFLDALGVDPGRIPTELVAQAALYRSLVADKRMLVVLDNAATAEQVVPLLPGGRSCIVLVTSRRILSGLIARHGARHLNLDVLTDTEARTLLERRLGAERLAAEPRAATDLLTLCRGFPLALGLLAGRAHTNPRLPLAQLAGELREFGVGALDDDDPTASLTAVLATSHQALTPEQRRVFGLLGIAPGPDIGAPAVACLTGLSPAGTGRVLRALQEASLLHRDSHGRYAMHDLIRGYAATTAQQDLPEDLRDAALERVVDFYLHTAHAANRLLNPHRTTTPLDPPAPGAHPHPLPDAPAALAWLSTEHACLLAAQHTGATRHRHQVVWQLAWALTTFHDWQGHRHDALAVWRAAADAVAHLPDPTTHVRTHRNLGRAYAELGRHEQALEHLHRALALAEHHHDSTHQAQTHLTLAWAWERRGDDRQALECARHALDLYRTLDHPVWEAHALNAVGWCAARLGAYDTARAHCQEALTLHRRQAYPAGEATALDSLGFIDHRTGHHQQAIDHYRQALTLRRSRGHTVTAAGTLDRLGHPHAALGQHDQARAVWQQALRLYRQLGRSTDAQRVQRQLDELDSTPEPVEPGAPENPERG